MPKLTAAYEEVSRKATGMAPMTVSPGLKTGMPIHYDDPREVGADRIVNGVAAFDEFGGPVIVVDFGTATNFDIVAENGDFDGSVIAPGAHLSVEALHQAAALLPRIAIRRALNVIGRDTVSALQSGVYCGYAGLVDGFVSRIKWVNGPPMTGGARGGRGRARGS